MGRSRGPGPPNTYHTCASANFAHGPLLNQLQGAAKRIGGHPLIAHLGSYFPLLGDVAKGTGFGDIVGNGLLDIDVLALFHGRCGDHSVGMVRRGHDDRIDLVSHFIQHPAEVPILFRLGFGQVLVALGHFNAFGQLPVVHIT